MFYLVVVHISIHIRNTNILMTCSINSNTNFYLTDFDECGSNPCQNGGMCRDGLNAYQCSCASGYTGTHCDKGASPITCQILYIIKLFL